MATPQEVRGDKLCDKLGGWLMVILSLSSVGIILGRMYKMGWQPLAADVWLASLYVLEAIGAVFITFSKEKSMRIAFWLYLIRVIAGFGYFAVVHKDKLATSTYGFGVVVLIYTIARIRHLKARP